MNHSAPEGYTSVAPWVVTDDTGALLDFITAAFDGVELARVAVEDGTIGHGEIRVGDTVVLAFDRRPDWPVMPSLLRVYVPDADAAMAAAVAHGARIVTEVRQVSQLPCGCAPQSFAPSPGSVQPRRMT